MTVDVEDWYHILDIPASPAVEQWGNLPSRVEQNFHRLLELFDRHGVRATCFFLGWIAERFPQLVREAHRAGHEIASHGYAHRLVYTLTPKEFADDALRTKRILETLTGTEVIGYRAAGFSVTSDTPWYFEEVARAGYRYDCSVFPIPRGHGGMASSPVAPYRLTTVCGELMEYPISTVKWFNRSWCLFGGGYLRLFPEFMVMASARRVLAEHRPVIFYCHPREIDPAHPRLPMNQLRQFKSYVNLSATEAKLERILSSFSFVTLAELTRQDMLYAQ